MKALEISVVTLLIIAAAITAWAVLTANNLNIG